MRTAIGGLRSSAPAFGCVEDGVLVKYFVLWRLGYRPDSAWSKAAGLGSSAGDQSGMPLSMAPEIEMMDITANTPQATGLGSSVGGISGTATGSPD